MSGHMGDTRAAGAMTVTESNTAAAHPNAVPADRTTAPPFAELQNRDVALQTEIRLRAMQLRIAILCKLASTQKLPRT